MWRLWSDFLTDWLMWLFLRLIFLGVLSLEKSVGSHFQMTVAIHVANLFWGNLGHAYRLCLPLKSKISDDHDPCVTSLCEDMIIIIIIIIVVVVVVIIIIVVAKSHKISTFKSGTEILALNSASKGSTPNSDPGGACFIPWVGLIAQTQNTKFNTRQLNASPGPKGSL